MKFILCLFLCASLKGSIAQKPDATVSGRFILKTNLTNIVALRPTLSAERWLNPRTALEATYVQGLFLNKLFTERYSYNGFVARIKRLESSLQERKLQFYHGGYVGYLKRTIQAKGGYVALPIFTVRAREFTGYAVRFGGTVGTQFITGSKLIFDGQFSLGYGTYLKQYDFLSPKQSNGHLDTQLWLNIGYCF